MNGYSREKTSRERADELRYSLDTTVSKLVEFQSALNEYKKIVSMHRCSVDGKVGEKVLKNIRNCMGLSVRVLSDLTGSNAWDYYTHDHFQKLAKEKADKELKDFKEAIKKADLDGMEKRLHKAKAKKEADPDRKIGDYQTGGSPV